MPRSSARRSLAIAAVAAVSALAGVSAPSTTELAPIEQAAPTAAPTSAPTASAEVAPQRAPSKSLPASMLRAQRRAIRQAAVLPIFAYAPRQRTVWRVVKGNRGAVAVPTQRWG